MDIKYDKYELLEIFESEPEDFIIPGAAVYKYSKVDDLGFELVMIMSVYENTVNLKMLYKDRRIFDTNMESVERVYSYNDTLHIQCTEEKKAIEVRFKPHFAINIREF
ncbi:MULTISPECIES: hypothetical protein [Bacillus]|uniref:hypothetical protein n=1 Tax=Bacillus TaxID=1386 RepID=UPI00032EE2D5|nr:MULTISPECIES: hypothetical protein [Bacillus cereus group]EOP52856.1 hypothetical protein IIW_02030 [Bacillus cereus VD136]EOP68487.1 hypothetical protein KOW_03696 [Bacillus cereus VDM006]MDF2086336.1 hypothetical protein [Bacillus pseudomycoides]